MSQLLVRLGVVVYRYCYRSNVLLPALTFSRNASDVRGGRKGDLHLQVPRTPEALRLNGLQVNAELLELALEGLGFGGQDLGGPVEVAVGLGEGVLDLVLDLPVLD